MYMEIMEADAVDDGGAIVVDTQLDEAIGRIVNQLKSPEIAENYFYKKNRYYDGISKKNRFEVLSSTQDPNEAE